MKFLGEIWQIRPTGQAELSSEQRGQDNLPSAAFVSVKRIPRDGVQIT